ncbi:MAG: hypothetical protein AAFX85_14645 [Pseudomonadota bacterium]
MAGNPLSGGGDLNGDGLGDLLIGAVRGESRKRIYVIYGSALGFPAQVELADLATGQLGINANDVDRAFATCANLTDRQVFTRAAPRGRLNCESSGLRVAEGDSVRVRAQGRVVTGSFAGTITGLTDGVAVCSNLTSGDIDVQFLELGVLWDCVAAGLSIAPGDEVSVLVTGEAQ